MKKVMFICTGNICRSAMAEGMFKKILKDKGIENVEVCSQEFMLKQERMLQMRQ